MLYMGGWGEGGGGPILYGLDEINEMYMLMYFYIDTSEIYIYIHIIQISRHMKVHEQRCYRK